MDYWPSYSNIRPESRAAYLAWLAGGRVAPSANTGYVFLFFYGLERRLLLDGLALRESDERSAILSEIERLRSIYSNRSFQNYSGSLLDFVRTISGAEHSAAPPAPPEVASYSLPSALITGLGRLSVAGTPIPSDWAFSWIMHAPQTRLRTPGRRCKAELQELFNLRYLERFGEGLVVKPNRTMIKVEYRPASHTFQGPITWSPDPPLPNITALSAPLRKLTDLLESCTSELEAYSRWKGKNPDAEPDLPALALLPKELADRMGTPQARELSAWLQSVLVESRVSIDADALIERWAPGAAKLSRSESVVLAEFLASREVGLEPDVRFGGAALARGTRAILFRNPLGSAQAPSQIFSSATVLLHLTAAVMQADGIDTAEVERVEQYLHGALPLLPGERIRLFAHLAWLLETPPRTTGLKKRLEALSVSDRQDLGLFLVSIAGADGVISPAEIDMLRKIYPILGLDREDVFSHVHGLSSSSAPTGFDRPSRNHAGVLGPAVAQTGTTASEGQEFTLDMNRVRARMNETAAVTELLGGIFRAEEEPGTPSSTGAQPVVQIDTDIIPGLDSAHSAFLRAIPKFSTVDRQAIESIASMYGVLPDGAIETLNELSFEACDEPLFEGEDPLDINLMALQELLK